MWALGVLLYQALSSMKHPFERLTQWQLINSISSEKLKNLTGYVSPYIIKLIENLLDKDKE
jgi:serine/threonine protein kinase